MNSKNNKPHVPYGVRLVPLFKLQRFPAQKFYPDPSEDDSSEGPPRNLTFRRPQP